MLLQTYLFKVIEEKNIQTSNFWGPYSIWEVKQTGTKKIKLNYSSNQLIIPSLKEFFELGCLALVLQQNL